MNRVSIVVGALLLFCGPTASVDAQIVRSPELKLQYHRAERAWRTGSSLLEARARLDNLLAELPEDGPARLLRAQVLLELDEPLRALDDARAAATLMPASGEAHLVKCEAAWAAGELAEATNSLEEAADLIKDDSEAHVRLSRIAHLLGATGQAEAFARVAVALDDQLPAAYRQLARVFMSKDRVEDAAKTLARGLRAGVLTLPMLESDPALGSLSAHAIVRAAL